MSLARSVMSDAEFQAQAAQQAKFAYGIVQTAGGGLGLLSFGPLAQRFGRRGAFAFMHAMALVIVPVTLLMFAIGISPQFLFNIFNTTVVQMARLFA